MCITSGPAMLSDTIVGTWDIEHPEHGYRHVLAYQNSPQNLDSKPNCMLLHIPAAKEILPEHILDTSSEANRYFLSGMVMSKHYAIHGRSRGVSRGNFVVQMGIYHIAILNHPEDYQTALEAIPEDKRPDISPLLIDFYVRNFYQYPLVLCCFNNRDAAKASPIMLHYAPKHSEIFMLPIIEAHGVVPQLGTPMSCQRTIVVGSYKLKPPPQKHIIAFDKNCDRILFDWLPNFGFVETINATVPNLDILFYRSDLLSYDPVPLTWHILPYHVAKLSHSWKSFSSKLSNWWDDLF